MFSNKCQGLLTVGGLEYLELIEYREHLFKRQSHGGLVLCD